MCKKKRAEQTNEQKQMKTITTLTKKPFLARIRRDLLILQHTEGKIFPAVLRSVLYILVGVGEYVLKG